MSDDTQAAFARQVRQHLDALKAAGIDYVPRNFTPPVSIPPASTGVELGEAVEPLQPPDTPTLVPPATDMATLFDTPPADVPAAADDRRHELQLLAERVAPCDRCPELFATRTQTVFGVGPVDADVCFVGEGPGADEDATGEPFVGKSGQLLDRIIAACGLKREEVYICNIIKCRPPNNRTPAPVECGNCREYLDRQLALVKPKFLVALGGVAAQNLLGSKASITKLRGKLYDYRGTPLICTFHPAYLLRDESKKKDAWDDMKLLLRTMGRPVPGARQ